MNKVLISEHVNLRSKSTTKRRELVYSLAEQHPGTLLLEYIILLCVKEGFEAELSRYPALDDRLSTFHARLYSLLIEAIERPVDDLSLVLRSIWQFCSASEAFYLITQQTLEELSWDNSTGRVLSGRLRRLSQDLEQHAALLRGSVPHELSFTLGHSSLPSRRARRDTNAKDADLQSERLEGSVIALVTAADLPSRRAAIVELHHAFSVYFARQEDTGMPPPLAVPARPLSRANFDAAGPSPSSAAAARSPLHHHPMGATATAGGKDTGGPPLRSPVLHSSISVPTELKNIVSANIQRQQSLRSPIVNSMLTEEGAAAVGQQGVTLGTKRPRSQNNNNAHDALLDVEETSLRPQSRGPLAAAAAAGIHLGAGASGHTPLLSPIRPVFRTVRFPLS